MYTLKIKDWSEEVDLTTGGYNVLRFDLGDGDMERPGESVGIWPKKPTYKDATGSVDLLITGSTQAQVQDRIRKLERVINRIAEAGQEGRLDRPRLIIHTDGDSEDWSSELLLARLEIPDLLGKLYTLKVHCTIYFTRRPFFEGAETELSISSSAHSARTGGVTITNTSDANWIQIAAAQVKGSLPAPVRLSVENVEAAPSRFLTYFWAINNAHASPTSLDMYRLGSESVGGTGAVNGAGTFASIRWKIPTGVLDAVKGKFVRALVVFSTAPGGARQAYGGLEVALSGGSYVTAMRGPLVEFDAEVVDLGVFPLPPGSISSGYDDLYFYVGIYGSAPVSATVHHLELIPVSSEKRLAMLGGFSGLGLETGEKAVLDDIKGESYVEKANGKRLPLLLGRGGPLLVYPNVAQRIVILYTDFSGGWEAEQSEVRAWYRPRRGTV